MLSDNEVVMNLYHFENISNRKVFELQEYLDLTMNVEFLLTAFHH